MGAQAWFMLLFFLILLIALSFPLSAYMTRISDAGHACYRPIGGLIGRFERLVYRAAGRRRIAGYVLDKLCRRTAFVQRRGCAGRVFAAEGAAWLPLNPQTFDQRLRRFRLQYRRQFRDQHQLAGATRASRR